MNTTTHNYAGDLFDFGSHAQATRAAAYADVKPKQQQRRVTALDALARAGDHGLTRHELADAIAIPLQSVCSVVLALLRDGLANEAGKRRPTPTGSPAAVMTITDAGRVAWSKQRESSQ